MNNTRLRGVPYSRTVSFTYEKYTTETHRDFRILQTAFTSFSPLSLSEFNSQFTSVESEVLRSQLFLGFVPLDLGCYNSNNGGEIQALPFPLPQIVVVHSHFVSDHHLLFPHSHSSRSRNSIYSEQSRRFSESSGSQLDRSQYSWQQVRFFIELGTFFLLNLVSEFLYWSMIWLIWARFEAFLGAFRIRSFKL